MYVTAILMGLAGGLHCAGMCGPLVLAATARNPFAGAKIIYNLGRVLTYSILGMIAAGIGGMFQIANYQNFLAYLLGGVLILIGFGVISGLKVPLLAGLVNKFTMWLKKQFGSFLQRKENIFYLGMLNGLLPCGLTYLALTFCFTLSYAFEGFLFMLVFGLGTIP
ncbi:MAG: sulfite exporter TauE/SafE family protein, partial [Cyclobacteriaceae bacterium]